MYTLFVYGTIRHPAFFFLYYAHLPDEHTQQQCFTPYQAIITFIRPACGQSFYPAFLIRSVLRIPL